MTTLLIKLFVKDYKNISNTNVRANYGSFASMVGIATNMVLFLIKIVTGLLFNSIAIIADAINNLSDSISSLVTLIGFYISKKPADSEHPYGHARMEYVAGMMVSFFIIFLGFQLIKTSFEKILQPEIAKINGVTIFILIVSILIKLWQCLFYRKIGETINSITLFAVSADSKNDILATGAILLGSFITLISGYNLDGYMGIVVALFILVSGFNLIKDTTDPLLGLAPTVELEEMIHTKILSYDSIIGLHDLHIHNYGANKCYASVHCEVPADADIMISHDIIDRIERDFLEHEGIHLVVHIDPVIINDQKTNELKVKVANIINELSPEIGMHDFRVVWGTNTAKLIFDIEIPFNAKWTEEEIVALIEAELLKIDNSYQSIIIVDRK